MLGYFSNESDHYLIFELCRFDLSYLLRHNLNFSRRDIAHFTHLFIKGLSLLKTDQNIYHRDIKPENILINHKNEFKLADFDISDFIEEDSEDCGIKYQLWKGSWDYLSPEIYKHYPLPGCYSREKSDVWSLGSIIFYIHMHYIITGKRNLSWLNKEFYSINNEIPWLSRLLSIMLCQKPKYRPRFKCLLTIIESDTDLVMDRDNYRKEWVEELIRLDNN